MQTFASEFEKKILTGAYQSVYRSGGETIVKTTKTKGSLRDITVPAPVIALARQWKSEQAQGRLRIGKHVAFRKLCLHSVGRSTHGT